MCISMCKFRLRVWCSWSKVCGLGILVEGTWLWVWLQRKAADTAAGHISDLRFGQLDGALQEVFEKSLQDCLLIFCAVVMSYG